MERLLGAKLENHEIMGNLWTKVISPTLFELATEKLEITPLSTEIYDLKEMTDDYGNEYFFLVKVMLVVDEYDVWDNEVDIWNDWMFEESENFRKLLNERIDLKGLNDLDHGINVDSAHVMNNHLVLGITALK